MNKTLQLLESFGGVGEDLLLRSEEVRRPRSWKRWGVLAACCVLAAAGVLVLSRTPAEVPETLDVPGIPAAVQEEDVGKRVLEDSAIGGEAVQDLTLAEALAMEKLGPYLLAVPPDGFYAESINWDGERLSALWCKAGAYDELRWTVFFCQPSDAERVTSVDALENYDLSLYPIPRAESVPEELREIVDHPIFLADELTADVLQRRAYTVNDAGDSGERLAFGVLYGDVLVEVSSKGVSAAWLWEQVSALG